MYRPLEGRPLANLIRMSSRLNRLGGLALVQAVLVDSATVDFVATVLTVSNAVTVLFDRNALLIAGRTMKEGRVRFVLI